MTIKIYLLCVLLAVGCRLAAQSPAAVAAPHNQQEVGQYTIRIIPAPGGGYGYSILRGPELMVHQVHHPVTLSPIGLRKKEDAYKLARWQIRQWQIANRALQGLQGQAFFHQPVRGKIARELRIDVN